MPPGEDTTEIAMHNQFCLYSALMLHLKKYLRQKVVLLERVVWIETFKFEIAVSGLFFLKTNPIVHSRERQKNWDSFMSPHFWLNMSRINMAGGLRNFNYGQCTELLRFCLNCFQIKCLEPQMAAMKWNPSQLITGLFRLY